MSRIEELHSRSQEDWTDAPRGVTYTCKYKWCQGHTREGDTCERQGRAFENIPSYPPDNTCNQCGATNSLTPVTSLARLMQNDPLICCVLAERGEEWQARMQRLAAAWMYFCAECGATAVFTSPGKSTTDETARPSGA